MPHPFYSKNGIGRVVEYSIVDQGEVRVDSSGAARIDMRLVVRMQSLDDSLTALRVGLPWYQKWQPHPNQANYGTELTLFVDEFQATQRKNTPWWDVQVTYTDTVVPNPLEQPAVIGEIQTFTLPGGRLYDYQGYAILNTAGEPPEPFDFPEKVMQIPIIKNVAPGLQSWLMDFEDCVNSAPVTLEPGVIAAAKTLLISSVKLSAINEAGGVKYRTCTVELLRRKSTWEIVFPSRGFNEKVTKKIYKANPSTGAQTFTTQTTLQPILIDGQPPTEPQFLDIDGKWIKNPNPNQVVLLKTLLQQMIDFNSTFPIT